MCLWGRTSTLLVIAAFGIVSIVLGWVHLNIVLDSCNSHGLKGADLLAAIFVMCFYALEMLVGFGMLLGAIWMFCNPELFEEPVSVLLTWNNLKEYFSNRVNHTYNFIMKDRQTSQSTIDDQDIKAVFNEFGNCSVEIQHSDECDQAASSHSNDQLEEHQNLMLHGPDTFSMEQPQASESSSWSLPAYSMCVSDPAIQEKDENLPSYEAVINIADSI